MNKIESIKNMADYLLKSSEKIITEEEFAVLLSLAESDDEKKLYNNLYNYLLNSKSKEIIKSGKF